MIKGTVKYFNDLKGWGIIASEEQPADIYVHYTDIRMTGFQTLKKGQEVNFDVTQAGNQLRAQNVSPIS